jgi:CheY-like chemotaxis protein
MSQPHTQKLCVVIADDNQDAATTWAMLFEGLGYQAHTAFDGATAVALIKDVRPDVALVDIELPEINGYGVAQAVRDSTWGKQVCLIALSGWSTPEAHSRADLAGFHAFFVKPAGLEDVEQVLARRGIGLLPGLETRSSETPRDLSVQRH